MFAQGVRALGVEQLGGGLVLQVEDLLITLTPTWIYERLLGMRTVFKGVKRVCMPAQIHHACSAY